MERLPIRACTTIQQYLLRSTPVPTPPSPQHIWKSTTHAIHRPKSEYPASTRKSQNKPPNLGTNKVNPPPIAIQQTLPKQGHSHHEANTQANRSRIPPTKHKSIKSQHMDRHPSRIPIYYPRLHTVSIPTNTGRPPPLDHSSKLDTMRSKQSSQARSLK